MRDVLEIHDRWTRQGKRVAVATVVGVKGSAPRGVGAKMVISSDGEMEGSVSGGCVENDVREHAAAVLASGTPRVVTYGIADDDAFEVGLTCDDRGVHRTMVKEIIDAIAGLKDDERLGAMITVIDGPDTGSVVVVDRSDGLLAGDGATWFDDDVAADARGLMDREESRSLIYGDRRIFIDTIAPSPIIRPHRTAALALRPRTRIPGRCCRRSCYVGNARAIPQRRRVDRRVAGRCLRSRHPGPKDVCGPAEPRQSLRDTGVQGRAWETDQVSGRNGLSTNSRYAG